MAETVKYTRLKGYAERNEVARIYRRLRKESPAMARLLWRRNRAVSKELDAYFSDRIMNGSTDNGCSLAALVHGLHDGR